ncbi:MAG: EamA family transporter [Deltaproteobacteria bacterium]
MDRWFWMALIAIALWGLGSFFGKLASAKDIAYRVYLFEGIGTITVLATFMLWKRDEVLSNFSVNYFGLLMGLCWGVGTVLFIIALKPAKLSVLVPLTAVYPVVTVLLAFLFLGERLSPKEIAGVALAIVSAVLLAR